MLVKETETRGNILLHKNIAPLSFSYCFTNNNWTLMPCHERYIFIHFIIPQPKFVPYLFLISEQFCGSCSYKIVLAKSVLRNRKKIALI